MGKALYRFAVYLSESVAFRHVQTGVCKTLDTYKSDC